jgi:uncharacterized protein RhaS with RHS repeats
LSEDPLEFSAGDPNLYAYVFNNPTNFIDPTGEAAKKKCRIGKKPGGNNPFGKSGKPDHQAKVNELADKARSEAKPGERVEQGTKIQGHDSTRQPDVQIIGKDGKTRKIFEAERHPNRQRNQLREEEYKRLGIENETHGLGN